MMKNRIKSGAVERSKLDLFETILPECEIWGNTILTVIEKGDHTIGVHRLTRVEFKVFEIRHNLFRVGLGFSQAYTKV